jgi:hypothetical protein
MKTAVCRLFKDPRRAEGTARELVLMQIPAQDITVTTFRGAESRSFQPTNLADDGEPSGSMLSATVDQEDVQRVVATLIRNGGDEIGPGAALFTSPLPSAR